MSAAEVENHNQRNVVGEQRSTARRFQGEGGYAQPTKSNPRFRQPQAFPEAEFQIHALQKAINFLHPLGFTHGAIADVAKHSDSAEGAV